MANFLLKSELRKTVKSILNFEYIFLCLDLSKIIWMLKIRNVLRYLVKFVPKLLIFN